ncbi:MAG: hemerythrin domain-containing protein [Pirellulales bacterium]|nr:hemerythrin domain-containing protein [Pirellulales bacterium]
MKPTEILKREHRAIETGLDCLELLADQCAAGAWNAETAAEALSFIRDYADHVHHGKEEDLLFPLLEAKGFSREQGPTGVMTYEHQRGRDLVRAMAEAVAQRSPERFAENARQFVSLLRQHIMKEDHCLFQMADQALSDSEQEDLQRAFEAFESDPQETTRREQALERARTLANLLGVSTAALDANVSATA